MPPTRLPLLPASALVLLVVVFGTYVRDIAEALGRPIPALPMPFGGSLLDNLIAALLAIAVACALYRGSALRALGLAPAGGRGPLLVVLAALPCALGLWLLGDGLRPLDPVALLMLAVLFPLAEEVLFRGLGFVFVVRVLGWPWVPAAILQALVFGAVHALNFGGLDGGSVAAIIFAVTTLGAFSFAWLNRLDGYRIWSGLALHIALNLVWSMVALPDAAALEWPSIALRLGAAALAIFLLWRCLTTVERRGARL